MRFQNYPFFIITFLVTSLCNGQTVESDTLDFQQQTLTVKDGLSQGLISCLLQDKDGLMWFGTKDGLNKYDGYNFTVYRHQQDNPGSLPGNYISSMTEDDNGNFWVGTSFNGLCLFDKVHEKFYPVKIPGSNDSTPGIGWLRSQNGQLMIIRGSFLIYDVSNIRPANYESVDLTNVPVYFDSEKMLSPKQNMGLLTFPFSAFLNWLPDNSLWFSCGDSVFGITNSKDGTYKNIKSFSKTAIGMDGDDCTGIYQLPQKNRVVFLGIKSMVVYDFVAKTIIKKILFKDGYPLEREVAKDKFGNYLITVPENNLNYYFDANNYTMRRVKYTSGITIVDDNGILWTGTSGIGIYKHDYRKQLFQPIKEPYPAGAPHNSKGELLLNSLNLLNPNTKEKKPLLPANYWKPAWFFCDYITDRQGTAWITYDKNGPESCLISYNPSKSLLLNKKLDLVPNGSGRSMIIDNKDNIWMCTKNIKDEPSLYRINKTNFSNDAVYLFPAKAETGGYPFVSSCWQDLHNVFWFATVQGLYSFNENKPPDPQGGRLNRWKHWTHKAGDKTSLSSDVLFSVLPDPKQPDKILWLGTDGGGLNRFEIATGKCINYTDKDGLPNNVVYGILNDDAGNLWLSTNKGISCFNPDEKTFQNFNSEDGLPGDEFNRYEYFKTPNGDMFFGGTEGGVVFNPKAVLEKENAPPIIFTGLSIYNQPVTYKTDSTIIGAPITYAKTITLPHDKNMFSISFAALEYRAAGKKNYKYLLENYDKQWIEAGNKNEATYTNLPPGSYTLHVKGKGSVSDWSKKDTAIQIIILPAWYQTWWFRILVAVLAVVAVYSVYKYRLGQALKLQKLRNRIATDLHDDIGSTLSSISLYSEAAKKMLNGNDKADKVLSKINSNTSEMMEAMSDIVWAINTRNDKFDNLFNRMRSFAVEVSESKNIALHFSDNKNLPDFNLDMVQRKNIYLIFKEALNNASKYSDCKNVWVEFSNHHRVLEMKIKDDGKGFAPLSLGEGQGVRLKRGGIGGNGLINMQNRTKDLNGELKIISNEGTGTEIILKMKL